MATMGVGMIVFGALIFFAACAWAVAIYNGLVSLRQQVERSWANIDVILKQRFDEIPQLVQVLQQFVGYEQSVIRSLVEARKHYGAATGIAEKVQASGELSLALRGVLAIGEGYPDLRSSAQFAQLQGRISALEDSLSDRREMYNETVTNLNTRIEQLPDAILARILGYQKLPNFTVAESEKSRPSLDLKLAG
ncbi:MAG: LemA family protein [Bdellovibrionales bacterium]|nr:LemA family protein [Bdellovibrionales bacterium]